MEVGNCPDCCADCWPDGELLDGGLPATGDGDGLPATGGWAGGWIGKGLPAIGDEGAPPVGWTGPEPAAGGTEAAGGGAAGGGEAAGGGAAGGRVGWPGARTTTV